MRLIMDIKYVIKRHNKFTYQRSVPADLQAHYGKSLIRVPLSSTIISDVKAEAKELAEKHSAEFRFLRGQDKAAPKTISELARGLLKEEAWDIDTSDLGPHEDHEVEKKERIHTVLSMWADEGDAVAKQAISIQAAGGVPLLSEAIEVWSTWKHEELNRKNLKQMRMSVNHLIIAVGDRPITRYTKKDAQTFITYCIAERGIKVSSLDRYISNLRSLFNRTINAYSLDLANPFLNLDLPRQINANEREEFSAEELEAIKVEAEGRDTDTALIALLQMNTGATVGEIAGLRIKDVDLESNIPSINIQAHEARTLKTQSRPRQLPLVGVSLDAAKKALSRITEGDTMLFERYFDGTEVKVESASAAVNKLVKPLSDGKTSHSFRHSMVNRLQREGTDLLTHYQITGHSLKTVNERSYNRSEIPLAQKLEALIKVAV